MPGTRDYIKEEFIKLKYPEEDALVEATFALGNGTDVEPDMLNLTIWKPVTYVDKWAEANKGNFNQEGNVWRYTKNLALPITTGTYLVHLNATYNGIEATETTYFRVATGGPYSVTLNCPSSSQVGSNLECTLVIVLINSIERLGSVTLLSTLAR